MAFDMNGFGQADGGRYVPISEHGLIGDLRTTALVGTNGTIDSATTYRRGRARAPRRRNRPTRP
ncbi:hypothetical protein ACFYP6_38595 [Streptomyces goshikiensis]|uniref:hypothetical protein n=1 Tax=Streptomyces goshikiensis TaxID=1942 RepID=UPI0036C2FE90